MSESPYRGIQPFRYVDRQMFFGRTSSVQQLYAKIILYRLVILFGDSGAGKSSLLNAGLVPALMKESFYVERIRVRPLAAQPILVERIPEGENQSGPFLPSFFFKAGLDRPAQTSFIALSLLEFCETLETKAIDSQVILVFDQFEEIFTLFEQKDIEPSVNTNALQQELLDAILRVVSQVQLNAKLVLVIREDFLGKLEVLVKQYPQVLDHRVRLAYLTGLQAKEAISSPFHSGSDGENGFPSQITEELASLIVSDLLVGSTAVPPTQVQIVCSRLWESYATSVSEIGPAEYQALGGIKGILEGFFGSEINHVEERLRPVAITILGSLITSLSTRDVVSRETIRQLAKVRGATSGDVGMTLDVLEGRRLIAKTFQRGTYYYEVASEYLIPVILQEAQQLAVELERAETQRQAAVEAAERARELEKAHALAEAQRLRAEEQQQRADAERRAAAAAEALALAEKGRADEQARSARRLRWMVVAFALVSSIAILFLLQMRLTTKQAKEVQIQKQRLSDLALIHDVSARVIKRQYDRDLSILLAAYAVSATYIDQQLVIPEAEQALHFALRLPSVRDLTSLSGARVDSAPGSEPIYECGV